MAFALHRLLRQLNVSTNRSISTQSFTTKTNSNVFQSPSVQFIHKQKTDVPALTFIPRSLNLDLNYLDNSTNISSRIIKCPVIKNLEIIEPPKNIIGMEDIEDSIKSPVQLPASNVIVEKQAARLIVIRKNKMKRHKLRKLRKKMKYEWAKVRQRREMRKEKAFQAILVAQIREAENFSAADYVAEKIRKFTEVPIPRHWKGRRLPEFIIREKLGLPKK